MKKILRLPKLSAKAVLFFSIIFSFVTKAQTISTIPDAQMAQRVQQHINYLASDQLQGRLTGSKYEKMSYKYIIKQYKQIGIAPKGSDGYLQAFTFDYGKQLTGKNELLINNTKLILNEDYYPLNSSGNGNVKAQIQDVGFGIVAPEISYDSYKGSMNLKDHIFLIECSTPEGDNPHSKFAKYAELSSKIDNAVKHGAIAIIFTNTQSNADDLKANLDINTTTATIPIVFVKSSSLQKVMKADFNGAVITTNLEKVTITGHNVVSFLDNHAATTIAIGAHYDHLGKGEYGNSLYVGEPAIHNGADDNASGTAGVIELARYFASNNIVEKNNFLFINFSGEEEGLVGSKNFVAHPTYDTSKINFMINMDMIGRYRADKGMEISGLGTSPDAFNFLRTLLFDSLKFKLSDGGTGPSDETSFYYANIPVLNFFTGTHEDYHKPSDDADKINSTGEAEILQLIESITQQLDSSGVLPFTKTKQDDNPDVPQFKVRLGIIPDYMYEGKGLRVDGVNEGQAASKAGIVKGDVIISIGDFKVGDINEYMKALAAFNKGDITTIDVKRGNMITELKVTF